MPGLSGALGRVVGGPLPVWALAFGARHGDPVGAFRNPAMVAALAFPSVHVHSDARQTHGVCNCDTRSLPATIPVIWSAVKGIAGLRSINKHTCGGLFPRISSPYASRRRFPMRRRRRSPIPPATSIEAIPLFPRRPDVARILNISVRTLRRQIQAGLVPAPAIRHPDRWRKRDILRLVAAG